MTIEQTEIIDYLGTRSDTGRMTLVISDHLDWEADEAGHLLLLQDKINTYLEFILSGQLLERYPSARDQTLEIRVKGKCRRSELAVKFYEVAEKQLADEGVLLVFEPKYGA